MKCDYGEIRLFTIQSTVSINQGSPDGKGGFLLVYQSKAGSKYGIVVLFSYSEAIWMKTKSTTWGEWKCLNTAEILSNLTTTNKSSLVGAINELNSKTLIITIAGSTDSTGNIKINVPNSFSRMPYVVTNIRDDLRYPYVVVISGWTQNQINFRIRNASDNAAIINTELPTFQCMLIGK